MKIYPSKNTLHAKLDIPNLILRGSEFPDGPHTVDIIGVSSYEKEQLTFIVKGNGGWIYTYIPSHYLSFGNCNIISETIFICPSIEFVVTHPLVEEFNTVHGTVKSLFCIDWLDKNELVHCGYLANGGAIMVYTHRNFKVNNPPTLKKMRQVWK